MCDTEEPGGDKNTMDKAHLLRDAFASGRLLIGGHVFLNDPSIAEAMSMFGYKALWIDGEHGTFDKEKILAHIVAANGAGAAAIVRVVGNDPYAIKPVLEMGPDGLIVPMVCSAEEAKRMVDACTYPPSGSRGFGPRRANRYGSQTAAEYLENADRSIVKIAQIEHIKAVENIDGILGVEGLDAVVIGPYDLSGSVGRLGQLTHPDLIALYDRIVAACKAKGKPCGVSIGPSDQEYMRAWIQRGVDFIFCGDDLAFMAMGAKQTIGFIETCPRQGGKKELL